MTSSNSASIFTLMLIAFLCNMMVNSAGLPTKADDAQTRQFLFASPYNYPNYIPANFYNIGGESIVNPYAVIPNESPNLHHVYAPSTLGEYAVEADYSRISRATVIILPADTECLTAETNVNGGSACKAASQERFGTIDIKLGADAEQSANVAITAPSVNTRIRLACTEIIAATAFTQNGKISAPSDTPRFEKGFLNLVVVSTGANARVKCSWRF